jgi:predicted RNA-binding protein YlxR (DUF448 family)
MTSTRAPERTCIGCRRRAPAAELARLALAAGRVVIWSGTPDGRRPTGRGASMHAQASCLRAALRTGALGRAFRVKAGGGFGWEPGVGAESETDLLKQLTAAVAAGRK